jgi:hypothetical protein
VAITEKVADFVLSRLSALSRDEYVSVCVPVVLVEIVVPVPATLSRAYRVDATPETASLAVSDIVALAVYVVTWLSLVTGAVLSILMVDVCVVSALPDVSTEAYVTEFVPSSVSRNSAVYVVTAPLPTAYHVRAIPLPSTPSVAASEIVTFVLFQPAPFAVGVDVSVVTGAVLSTAARSSGMRCCPTPPVLVANAIGTITTSASTAAMNTARVDPDKSLLRIM